MKQIGAFALAWPLLLVLAGQAATQGQGARESAPSAAPDFYRGKQLKLIVGTASGQDYDVWARLGVTGWSWRDVEPAFAAARAALGARYLAPFAEWSPLEQAMGRAAANAGSTSRQDQPVTPSRAHTS